VVKRSGLKEPVPGSDATVDIVQRLSGGGGTDFGVPSESPKQDGEPLKGKELARQRALLEASWKAFDAAARSAKGKTLRLGPRGGGRNLAKMTGHVLEAEVAYLGALGSKPPKASTKDAMAEVRKAALATLDAVAHGRPVENPRNTKRPWSPRYFIRRSAWHALDHAWEIEDRLSG
jgi:DinB superfamily